MLGVGLPHPVYKKSVGGFFRRTTGPLTDPQSWLDLLHGVLRLIPSTIAFAFCAVATLVVLTAYFIVDGSRAFRWFVSLWSPPHVDRLTATLSQAEERISRWIFGQLLLMFILATADLIVYGAVGINYFYVLAAFVLAVPVVFGRRTPA